MVDLAQGIQSFGTGQQLGSNLGELFTRGKRKREFDRLLSDMGNNMPTQEQFIALSNTIGPEAATGVMQYHIANMELSGAEKEQFRQNTMFNMDMLNRVTEGLLKVPEEDRMDAFASIIEPLAQNPENHGWLKPIVGLFQSGNFSNGAINTLRAMSASIERLGKMEDNALKREELGMTDQRKRDLAAEENATKIQVEEIKARGKLTQQQAIEAGFSMAEEHGGRPADWAIYLTDRAEWTAEGGVGGGGEGGEPGSGAWINKATGRPLDLGRAAESLPRPGEEDDDILNTAQTAEGGLLGDFREWMGLN